MEKSKSIDPAVQKLESTIRERENELTKIILESFLKMSTLTSRRMLLLVEEDACENRRVAGSKSLVDAYFDDAIRSTGSDAEVQLRPDENPSLVEAERSPVEKKKRRDVGGGEIETAIKAFRLKSRKNTQTKDRTLTKTAATVSETRQVRRTLLPIPSTSVAATASASPVIKPLKISISNGPQVHRLVTSSPNEASPELLTGKESTDPTSGRSHSPHLRNVPVVKDHSARPGKRSASPEREKKRTALPEKRSISSERGKSPSAGPTDRSSSRDQGKGRSGRPGGKSSSPRRKSGSADPTASSSAAGSASEARVDVRLQGFPAYLTQRHLQDAIYDEFKQKGVERSHINVDFEGRKAAFVSFSVAVARKLFKNGGVYKPIQRQFGGLILRLSSNVEELRPLPAENRPPAVLFLGRLDAEFTTGETLEKILSRYGDILDIELRPQIFKRLQVEGQVQVYVTFVEFKSVVAAVRDTNGLRNRLKSLAGGKYPLIIQFHYRTLSPMILLRNISTHLTKNDLYSQFDHYGSVLEILFRRTDPGIDALVVYQNEDYGRRGLLAFHGTAVAEELVFGSEEDYNEFSRAKKPDTMTDSVTAASTATSTKTTTTANSSKADSDTWTLYVANVDNEVSMDELKSIFGQYGKVVKVFYRLRGPTKTAYISFASFASLKKARDEMQRYSLRKRNLHVEFHKEELANRMTAWVFLGGGVASFISTSDLRTQFGQYGVVKDVFIDRKNSQGLIRFDKKQTAMEAVMAIEGTSLDGKEVHVGFADFKTRKTFFDHLLDTKQMSAEEMRENSALAEYIDKD